MNEQYMVSVSLDREQLQKLKFESVRGRAYSERISVALAFRLLDTSDPYFDYFSVLDELEYLEGIRPTSRTKPEQQFTKEPLFPLWHKHFFLAKHLVKNIGIRWNMHDGGNKELTRMLNEVAEQYGGDCDNWPSYLSHRLVDQGFDERTARGLTGDWIIFAKHEGKNYYLDLATHEEALEDNVYALVQKLKGGCHAEFPFLFE